MARLRDIKVGMTVWVKKGRTSPERFGLRARQYIGKECEVQDVDPNDEFWTIKTEDYWFPIDWISLTPPDDIPKSSSKDASKEASKEAPKKKLYVAEIYGNLTQIGTIEDVVRELQDGWDLLDAAVAEAKFYELTEVKIQYTPAKFEVVE